MLWMTKILNFIPKKVWLYGSILVGLSLAFLYVHKVGESEGYHKAVTEYKDLQREALESSLGDVNTKLDEALANQLKAREQAYRTDEVIKQSINTHNTTYQEILNEAKDSQPSSQDIDCNKLSVEYVRLFESIYPTREE